MSILTDYERKFYASLPEHLGKARIGKLVEVVDQQQAKIAELQAEVKRLREYLPQGWALVEPVEYSRYLEYVKNRQLCAQGGPIGRLLDCDEVARLCCEIAYRNGWILEYKLEKRQ